MKTLAARVRAFFVSLELTVVLLVLGMVLVFAATLSQVNLGVWAVQKEFFHSLIAFWRVGPLVVPLPGGYLVGGLLLINLLAAHAYRFRFAWRKSGILLTHLGLILLLVGELLSGLMQQEFNLRLNEGETRNYAESYRNTELAITDVTDPKTDEVVAIPESLLVPNRVIQHPKLPFQVVTREFYPNAASIGPAMRTPGQELAPNLATVGLGTKVALAPQPLTYKENERNTPGAFVELIGPQGSLGTWMVASDLEMPQRFDYGGRTWKIALRFQRRYQPFSVTLLKFSHDVYPGTDIPKNFSSRVRLRTDDGRTDREVLIYMNNPLRYAGLTFYQSGYDGEHTTILQVVRNPSWLMPYIACALVAVGLLIQFAIHLVGFIGKARSGRTRGEAGSRDEKGAAATAPDGNAPPPPRAIGRALRHLPALILIGSIATVLATLLPPRNTGAFDLVGFGRLPVLAGGRFKPLDTIARTALLQIEHHQTAVTANHRDATMAEFWANFSRHVPLPREARTFSATEWLLDVCFRPEMADTYPVFRIVNLDVLSLFDLKESDGRDGEYFAFDQLESKLDELERQGQLAQSVDSAARSPFQRGVLQLYDNLLEYQRLRYAVAAPGDQNFLGHLLHLQDHVADGVAAVRAKQAGQPHDEALVNEMIRLGQQFSAMAESTNLLAIPPDHGQPADHWQTTGAALLETFQTGRVDPAALAYAGLERAWRDQQPDKFNRLVSLFRADLERQYSAQIRKSDVEVRFNAANPFTSSFTLYAIAFLAGVISWLVWPRELGRLAFWLVLVAWLVATAGILTRMWLEGRPPVTNLYSSALFVGWVAVALCLVLEKIYRNAIGSVAAGLIGFGTLIIADRLSLSGDTMEMMRAVLDSNYWLATHVVVVASGYSATFLAGFLAIIYITRGVFTKTLDQATADALTRMTYGIVCFATLFSFAGTVLGGIWADQSWGRFWGWDPKENGALIIVIWNAIILHARWGGMIKQRGLMCLAIGGNIVTGWSWFGTNMLGVGLHSYGFTDAAFWSLSAFWASQLALIAIALTPLERWRSFGRKVVARSEPVPA